MAALRPPRMSATEYREFRELLIAAVNLTLYGEDELGAKVRAVALRINDGSLRKK